MPCDDIGHSSTIVSVTGETIQLYYYHSTTHVLTTDAGQAAGVVVVGQLTYENIQNALGTMQGSYRDSSLSFTSGVFTTEKELEPSILESVDDSAGYLRATAVTAGLANGEYVVDYANGTLYGKKTTTGTTLANAAYKIKQGVVAAASTTTENVNVKTINSVTPLMGNGATGTGSQRVTVASDNTPFPVKIDQTTPGTTNAVVEASASAIKTAVEIMDDWDESDRAKVNPIVGQAGVAAGAGAVGVTVPRVTLASDDPGVALLGTIDADTGAIKTATELLDDAVYTDDTSTFTPATNKAIAIGGLVDDTATDSADEGDFAALRLSARRAAMVSLDTRLDQTNDAISIYGSDDGGTTKRIIKTDSGGAIQVDLEVASVAITGGQAADGAAVSGNPVRIGGKDGAGNTQDIITDTDGHVQVDVLSSAVPTVLTGGSKTVTVSGTGETLGTTLAIKSVYIRAKSTNTGDVYVGDSSVDATTSKQLILSPNDSVTLSIADRATVYVDVAVNGEGVDYLCAS